MNRCLRLAALVSLSLSLLVILPVWGGSQKDPAKNDVKTREFLFTYETTVTGLKAGQNTRIWLPMPKNSEYQTVKVVKYKFPSSGDPNPEPKYRNKILYVQARPNDSGMLHLSITYRILRKEIKGGTKTPVSEQEAEQFLKPDKLVPIGGKPLTLIEGKKLPQDQLALAKLFYAVVDGHMEYSKTKGQGWGRGDAEWACDSKFGNCTDFHSLFISLARTHKIPAKFEMGFPLPAQRGSGEIGGYHCWAFFNPKSKGWIPVDISEMSQVKSKDPNAYNYYFGNLTENRVTFTVGRDINLVPQQSGPPLNFFIYPYVEVDGQPYPADKIQRKFTYQDVNN